jgi:hypothetical protein
VGSGDKLMKKMKRRSQLSTEIDEEKTSQLVSQILRNIKEKTKELESINQNLKYNKSIMSPQPPHSTQPHSNKDHLSADIFDKSELETLNQNAIKTKRESGFLKREADSLIRNSSYIIDSERKPKRSIKSYKSPKINPSICYKGSEHLESLVSNYLSQSDQIMKSISLFLLDGSGWLMRLTV